MGLGRVPSERRPGCARTCGPQSHVPSSARATVPEDGLWGGLPSWRPASLSTPRAAGRGQDLGLLSGAVGHTLCPVPILACGVEDVLWARGSGSVRMEPPAAMHPGRVTRQSRAGGRTCCHMQISPRARLLPGARKSLGGLSSGSGPSPGTSGHQSRPFGKGISYGTPTSHHGGPVGAGVQHGVGSQGTGRHACVSWTAWWVPQLESVLQHLAIGGRGASPEEGLLPMCGCQQAVLQARLPRSPGTVSALFPVKLFIDSCDFLLFSRFHCRGRDQWEPVWGRCSVSFLALGTQVLRPSAPALRPGVSGGCKIENDWAHTHTRARPYHHSHRSREFADAPIPPCPRAPSGFLSEPVVPVSPARIHTPCLWGC